MQLRLYPFVRHTQLFWHKTIFAVYIFTTLLPLSFIKMLLSQSDAKWINFFPALFSSQFSPSKYFSASELYATIINPNKVVSDSAVTHVTTGAKSEHSGQHDANMLEIYPVGFIVLYFI